MNIVYFYQKGNTMVSKIVSTKIVVSIKQLTKFIKKINKSN